MGRVRWIFAGQLGDTFDDGGPMLLIEARSVLRRRPIHRAKAHLILSAMRHRAAELGDRVEFHQVEAYSDVVRGRTDLEVIDPTSWAARRTVRRLGAHILPSRGFVTTEEEFASWAAARGDGRLLLEDFYRHTRERTGLLMEGSAPAGGRWNYDGDNRQPPPKNAVSLGLPDPRWPEEDDIDAGVRAASTAGRRTATSAWSETTVPAGSPRPPPRPRRRSPTSSRPGWAISGRSRMPRSAVTGPWLTRCSARP